MNYLDFKKQFLSASVAIASIGLSYSNSTIAQDDTLLEEIVVTGSYSQSLQSAIDTKRNADNVIDAIIAEDIGKFPAHNIAEALQRVTGVSIVRDRGEGVYVRVRGLGSNFQVTTLNSRTMAVNENVRTSGQFGRQFRFDTLPAELVSSVEVIKSPTAALDEGAIGGTVNVNTFRPLDLGSNRFNASAQASHSELADETDPRFSGLVNWVNDDQTFGALVSAAYAERSVRQDRAINFGWRDVTEGIDTTGDGILDSGPVITPGGIRPTLEFEDRERIGVSTAFQWRPTDALDVNLDLLYVDQTVQYDELTYSADYDHNALVPGSAIIRDGALVGGATEDGSVQIARESSGIQDENFAVGLNAEWLVGDWILSGDLFHATADSEDSDPILRTRLRRGDGIAFSFLFPKIDGRSVPSIEYHNADLLDPADWPGRRLEWREIRAEDQEQSLQFDASRQLDSPLFSELVAGIKLRDRSRGYQRRDLRYYDGIEGEYFDDSYFVPHPATDFLDDARGDLPSNWLVPDESRFWVGLPSSQELASEPGDGDLRNSYEIDESIYSAYAMVNLDTRWADMPLRGNLGVRVSQTEQTSSGHASLGGETVPVSFSSDYTNVLPSANFALDITEDIITRVAVAKVITRPDLQDMAPRLTFNSGDVLTAVGGNPNLEPFEAWQYDLTLEWYPSDNTALTAGLFHKDISTFIQTQNSDLVFGGETYLLSSKVNGSNAEVTGVELAYQQVFNQLPSPFDGLGVQANYTYTDSSAVYVDGDSRAEGELEDVAKNSYNLSAFYEKGGFDMRFSYSWRDKVLNQIGTNNLATENNAEFGSLDFSTSYDVNDALNVFAEGINITNEAQQLFVADDQFRSYTNYGRTFSVGLRLSY